MPSERSPELLAMLADRAMFSRLETVRLATIAGAGHYTGAFSAAAAIAIAPLKSKQPNKI